MSFTQTLISDSRVLWNLLASPTKGNTHRERLNNFYQGQASSYDSFRQRLLHGRQEMITAMPVKMGDVWVDLGCGTGENIERFGDRLSVFSAIHLVDLCEPLLKVASERRSRLAEPDKLTLHEADATRVVIPDASADLVTFSYSLTMIPDWFAAIDNALRILRPGGYLGVADFFVSRKHASGDEARHGWLTRTGWPTWFAMDNVFLNPDHLPMLRRRLDTVTLVQNRGHLAYLPFFKVPYYVFVGRKPLAV